MQSVVKRYGCVLTGLIFNILFLCSVSAEQNSENKIEQVEELNPTGREIVRVCDNKYPGENQKTQLGITLIDRSGNERKTIYLRLWKDVKGKDEIFDKMVLFTLYPPDAKGAGFMRWSYTRESNKKAEQWIYLPTLRKIRRVSVRDLGDSFLGSDLTYGDISYRQVDDDVHELIRIDRDKQGQEYYVVVSVPNEPDSLYSKKISWYSKTEDMDSCLKIRVDYYDRKDALLKRQSLKWQKVSDAWVWEKVLVQNAQTFHKSIFDVSKVKINGGIDDDWFTERRLRKGIKLN